MQTRNEDRSGHATFNWVFGIATVPAAIGIVGLVYLQIMGTAGCRTAECPTLDETTFTLIEFGVPAVAVLTVVASFFTARRRGGVLVPILAWALILLAAVVLYFAFRS